MYLLLNWFRSLYGTVLWVLISSISPFRSFTNVRTCLPLQYKKSAGQPFNLLLHRRSLGTAVDLIASYNNLVIMLL
jgi:hypothetical protein